MNKLNKFILLLSMLPLALQAQWQENENGIYYLGNVGIGGLALSQFALSVNGTTRSDGFDWGLKSRLHGDQGGAIELGEENVPRNTPYIDFHYGLPGFVEQDYNARIVNTADNQLDFVTQNGSKMNLNGNSTRFGFQLPSITLSNLFVNGFTSGNSLIFQNGLGRLGIDFWNFGTNGVMNFYADYNNENYNQLAIKSDNTVAWGNDESWLTGYQGPNQPPSINLNKAGTNPTATPYIDFTSGYSFGSNHIDVRIKNSAPNTLEFWTNMDINGNGGNKIMSVKNDGIYTKKLTVQATWSDFVFESGYHLLSLTELEKYINENGHLPEIPNESYISENGVELGEMASKLLQKIEELSLYLIELNKQVETLKNENSEIKSLLINK